MAFGKSLQGVVKLMIGASPDLSQLKIDADKGVGEAANQIKKMTAMHASIAAGALIGMGTISVGLIKAAQSAIAFEESFAGIRKTVEASDAEFARLSSQIKELSTVIPVGTDELNRIGELGGQLGIATQSLPEFIKTVSTLATTTNLTVDNAALGLARLDAIAQTNGQTFENMSSVIVDLGNNFAATESEIMTTVLRIAQAAAQVGATTEDALAFAAALQAIGVPAQAGGTAVARVFQAINEAVITGGESLEKFATIAEASGRVTADNFADSFGADPAMAVVSFIEGLNELNKEGVNIIQFLDDLDLKQRRTMLSILGLAEAEGVLADAVNTARNAFEENNAALDEAVKRYTTTASQIEITKNTFSELGIQIGENLIPAFRGILDTVQETILAFSESETVGKRLAQLFITLGTVASLAVIQIMRLNGVLTTLKAHPIMLGITALTTVFTAFAVSVAKAEGEMIQLRRNLDAFAQDGKVTENTIKAILDTTLEFDKVLSGLSFEDRFNTENMIAEAIVGGPSEQKALIEHLNTVIESNELILEQNRMYGDQEAVMQAAVAIKSAKDVLGIMEEINVAIIAREKLQHQNLRTQAMEALGIKRLAEEGTRARAMQEQSIILHMQHQKAVEADKEAMAALSEEMTGLKSMFEAIDEAVVDSTDSFVRSFQALPEAVILSADQMVENFRTRFLLTEIFKAQIDELKALGNDDLALFFAQLGPESAPNLANLLASPEAMAELEAGLEATENTVVKGLKDQSTRIAEILGNEFGLRGTESGIQYMDGLTEGFKAGAPKTEGELSKKLEGIANIADIIFDTGSPSKRMKKLGNFIMLGFTQGIQQGYPTLEREFKGQMIDLVDMIESSVNDAVSAISGSFSDQFGAFGSMNNITKMNKDLNKLLAEQTKLYQGNTAAQTKAIFEAQERVDFLTLAVSEGTAPLFELQIAEEELAKAKRANADEQIKVAEDIESIQTRIASGTFSAAKEGFGLLQAGPEAVTQFEEVARILGIDEQLISKITTKSSELANTLGTDFAGVINDISQDYFDFNLKVEQEKITLNLDTTDATMTMTDWLEWYTSTINSTNNAVSPSVSTGGGSPNIQMYAGGGRIPMYAKGGTLGSGYGIVGEAGPELIRAIPGGGVDITPIGSKSASSITISNLNVNVTGVPSDPMQARKAAIAIKKELSRLDKEGHIGTGIRGR
jgi:TP901 family phage tail tape measure protein